MALVVYKIDDTTRIILPGSQWGCAVREKLGQMGHKVMPTDQDPNQDDRSDGELDRMAILLDSTGM